jgi:hypothetical protein
MCLPSLFRLVSLIKNTSSPGTGTSLTLSTIVSVVDQQRVVGLVMHVTVHTRRGAQLQLTL